MKWVSEPPTSLNSWGVRLIIASIVSLLFASILLLAAVNGVNNTLNEDRADRDAQRARSLDRTCLLLVKLHATDDELRQAGCK